jgi:NAD-dependent SIR2 family protein deacetylase
MLSVDYASPMEYEALREFIERHSRLFILTGAGCSTESGIPDYRNADGDWKRAQPVQFRAFIDEPLTRQRYWARSLVGWRRFGRAKPNDAHYALAALERHGKIELLVTQNVDGLHQAAGSAAVVDLHGRLDTVRCMGCEQRSSREELQQKLLQCNPRWAHLDAADAPDGDADLHGLDFSSVDVPACETCGGLLKPDVVFYGESVPRERVEKAMQAVRVADAMLVIGSSLMVYSGFRFAREAAALGKPLATVNLGRTRADDLLTLKVTQSCSTALAFLLQDSQVAS